MPTVSITPERMAQLDDYARRQGWGSDDALDQVLNDYLAWEHDDFEATLVAVNEAWESVKAGRTSSSEASLEALRIKHGLPG